MTTRPKTVIESHDGEELSPITITKNVLTDDGQNLHDILSDRKEDMITPTIENSSSIFKVGQGDIIDYSESVVDGAYKSCVLKGVTRFIDNDTGEIFDSFVENRDLSLIDCKSPVLRNIGKNLFNHNIEPELYYLSNNGNYEQTPNLTINQEVNVKDSSLTFSFSNKIGDATYIRFGEFDKDKKFIKRTLINTSPATIFLNDKTEYVVFSVDASSERYFENLQIEQGEQKTTYEPYKTNILHTQEDVELRGIGDVQDALDCLTGELTQRIGEIMLDGSENWIHYTNGSISPVRDVVDIFYTDDYKDVVKLASDVHNLFECRCAMLPAVTYDIGQTYNDNTEGCYISKWGSLCFSINKAKLPSADLNGFKQWLEDNNLIIQFELATPTVSTIDIQGFPYAYTNGHVILSSDSIEQSITPKVEYSVMTNRDGQIRSNQKMVERQQKELDRLQAMILANLVNTQYEQTLTNLKYDLKNVREEVK